MPLTFEGLPDEILGMVIETIVKDAYPRWPLQAQAVPNYGQQVQPTMAALVRTSKRLRDLAKPYLHHCTILANAPSNLRKTREALRECRILRLGRGNGPSTWHQGKQTGNALLKEASRIVHLEATVENKDQAELVAELARAVPDLQYLDVNFGPTNLDSNKGLQNSFFMKLLNVSAEQVDGDFPHDLPSFTIRGRTLFTRHDGVLFQRFLKLAKVQDLELYGLCFTGDMGSSTSLMNLRRLCLDGPFSSPLDELLPSLKEARSLSEFWVGGCKFGRQTSTQIWQALPPTVHTLGMCCVDALLFDTFRQEVAGKRLKHIRRVVFYDSMQHLKEDSVPSFVLTCENCYTFSQEFTKADDGPKGQIQPSDWLMELKSVGDTRYGKSWFRHLPKAMRDDFRSFRSESA